MSQMKKLLAKLNITGEGDNCKMWMREWDELLLRAETEEMVLKPVIESLPDSPLPFVIGSMQRCKSSLM